MYPFRRILIPTDFSTASQWAFDYAARIAIANNAELLILHIRMTWEKDPNELRFPADPSLYEYVENQELEKLRAHVRAMGGEVPTRLIVKNAPEAGPEVCRTVSEEDVDLVAIATHARHHVAHLLIGSTTMSVLKDPPAPILAIRYGIQKRERMARIIVPVHMKQTSHAALDLALTVARRRGTELHLVTVTEDRERADAESLLEKLKSANANVSLKTVVLPGTDIDREIVRYSAKSEADVIFLNAEKRMGTAKRDIVRQAETPVMLVPLSK
jgi:nucleotide-binding universal stress UspA family protein